MSELAITDIATINPPLTRTPKPGELISFVSMSGVSEGGGITESIDLPFNAVSSGFTRFQNGDVLFAKITPCMENGKGALAENLTGGIGCGSTEFHVLRATQANSPAYLYQLMQWKLTRQTAEIFMSGSAGQQRVQSDFFRRYKVYAPAQSIQTKIATILTAIDTAIEKTEALIAKYQQIKAGLMHDLFTRGVLPNGQLRPPREQAPELYQETVIGWIPMEWNVSTLEGLLASLPNSIRSGPFGSALLKHELVEDGIPFLGIDNIHVEHFEPVFRRFVSERKFLELAKYKVRPRDVVITIMGTVGRCCVIPDDLELALSSKHLWTMTFDPEKVVPELVCWQLNHSSSAQAWFRRAMQGGIMDAIQSSTLKTLVLPVPGMDEQILIYERYLKVSTRIRQDSELLNKLRKQKSGLMHDLLTGKVRVKVAEPEVGYG